MAKVSETYSKWKSIGEGLVAIVLGLLLVCFGQVVPITGLPTSDGLLFLVGSVATIDAMVSRKVPERKYICNSSQALSCSHSI